MIRTLGRFFTIDVDVGPGQWVVKTGPYRLVRHPTYSGPPITLPSLKPALSAWAFIVAVLTCGLACLI